MWHASVEEQSIQDFGAITKWKGYLKVAFWNVVEGFENTKKKKTVG